MVLIAHGPQRARLSLAAHVARDRKFDSDVRANATFAVSTAHDTPPRP